MNLKHWLAMLICCIPIIVAGIVISLLTITPIVEITGVRSVEIGTFFVVFMAIACPIMMGGMMWWMMRNNHAPQSNQPPKHLENANQHQLIEDEINSVDNEVTAT